MSMGRDSRTRGHRSASRAGRTVCGSNIPGIAQLQRRAGTPQPFSSARIDRANPSVARLSTSRTRCGASGRCQVEAAFTLVAREGWDKGMVVQLARSVFCCDRVIYVLDDDTDEDAFTCARPERLLGIRVGAVSSSTAHVTSESRVTSTCFGNSCHSGAAITAA